MAPDPRPPLDYTPTPRPDWDPGDLDAWRVASLVLLGGLTILLAIIGLAITGVLL